MIGGFDRFFVVLAAAIATYVISYVIYRKTSVAFWGYVFVWFNELPMFILFITSGKELTLFDIFTHTLAMPILAVILVIADILLIELALIGVLRPIKFLLPKSIASSFKIFDIVKTLQKYHAIPKPERVQSVFFVSLLGGLISLVALIVAGAFA
jgi:hypothetical protein